MLTRLLHRLLGKRCGLCYGRYHDLAAHQLHDHNPCELRQWMEMNR